jgi:hypothetical protein
MGKDVARRKTWTCPVCHRTRRLSFCPSCGEQRLRRSDLTLADLAAQFAKGFSSIDGRLLRSFRSILTAPGDLTRAYVHGERRKFLGPLALFFVANALFVGSQALTGTNVLSSPLESHLHRQDWSPMAQTLVGQRLAARHIELAAYAPVFDRAAIFNAKALMILMVLALAPLLALIFFRRHRAAGVHIVFALHLYTFVLILLSLSVLLAESDLLMGGSGLNSRTVDLVLSLFNFSVCATYVYLAIRPTYRSSGPSRIVETALLSIAIATLFVLYRFAIFLITFFTT